MYDPRATATHLQTFITSGFGDDAESVELDCLAVATCFDKTNDEHKQHAKLAKKALKKHASAPVAAALARITRRNFLPKIDPKRQTTPNAFLKQVARLDDDFNDLAQLPDFDHIGFAARLVALYPKLLVYLLARRDLTFFADYFAHGHPRDTIELKEFGHPDNSKLEHTFSRDEVAALARIPRFTHIEIRTDEVDYPLPDDLSAWSELTYLKVHMTEVPPRKNRDLTQEQINALGALPKLTHLHLIMRLAHLPDDLSPLRRLTTLDLGSNLLRALPDSIGALNQLQTLNLYNNAITALPDGVGELTSLETLDLRGLPLKSCSPRIGELHSLRKLHVSSREDPTELLTALRPLTGLRHLSLNSGLFPLKALPDALGELTGLEYLSIHGFSYLEKGFAGLGNLTRLVTLRLEHIACRTDDDKPGRSGVPDMFEELGALANLEVLSLASTYLKGIPFPDQIVHCSKLRELNLEHTFLNAPSIDFSRLPALERLNLKSITMASYPDGFFTLARLQQLKLGGAGSVPNLPEEVRGLKALEVLELHSYAPITKLPDAFTELHALQYAELTLNDGFEGLPDGLEKLTGLLRFRASGCFLPDFERDIRELRLKMPWCSFRP